MKSALLILKRRRAIGALRIGVNLKKRNERKCSVCGEVQFLSGEIRSDTCHDCLLRYKKPRLGTGNKNKSNCNGYRMIYVDGKRVYEHRHVAEQKIGRKLLKGEHVHHIDGNKINNVKENLEVISGNNHVLKFHSNALFNSENSRIPRLIGQAKAIIKIMVKYDL